MDFRNPCTGVEHRLLVTLFPLRCRFKKFQGMQLVVLCLTGQILSNIVKADEAWRRRTKDATVTEDAERCTHMNTILVPFLSYSLSIFNS
jgi:hypothetical protein